jgi:penicillin-insensitive murein DD-endopeptidase
MIAQALKNTARVIAALAISLTVAAPAFAEEVAAKKLFGAVPLPALMEPQAAGFYSKGCLAGGVAIPVDGPAWQVMRLSRNRNWGHPNLIRMLEKLALDGKKVGWNGLLIGDISQPRGGPMLTGHASHQIGLDADIWLTPMPNRTLTRDERETLSATSMLKGDSLYVDPDIWTPGQAEILKLAASQPQVERIFVHPGIKKKLCDTTSGDRAWLGKIRPYWGHFYHFHVRMKCPAGVAGCKGQEPAAKGDGCGDALAWWFTDEPWKPAKKPTKPVKPKIVTLKDLPPVCAQVLDAAAPASAADATYGQQ